MQFMRRTVGYTLSDHKRNEEIITDLCVTNNKIYRIQKKLERTC